MRIVEDSKVTPIAVARARRRIADHFLALQAIEPDKAIEFAPQSLDELREFERLRSGGIVRDALPGHYWMDLDVHQSARKPRRRVLPIIAAGLLILVWGWAYYHWG